MQKQDVAGVTCRKTLNLASVSDDLCPGSTEELVAACVQAL